MDPLPRRVTVRHCCEGAEQDVLWVDQYKLTKELSGFGIVMGVYSDRIAPRPVSVSLAAPRSLWGSLELVGGKRVTEAACQWGTCAEERSAIDWT